MTEHHGQHARCRACGTNPRSRQEPVAERTPDRCPDCGADLTWVWSPKHQQQLLRRCPCKAPKGDKELAHARLAAIKEALATRKPTREEAS